jgi:hypothetical protein
MFFEIEVDNDSSIECADANDFMVKASLEKPVTAKCSGK